MVPGARANAILRSELTYFSRHISFRFCRVQCRNGRGPHFDRHCVNIQRYGIFGSTLATDNRRHGMARHGTLFPRQLMSILRSLYVWVQPQKSPPHTVGQLVEQSKQKQWEKEEGILRASQKITTNIVVLTGDAIRCSLYTTFSFPNIRIKRAKKKTNPIAHFWSVTFN